MKYSVAELDHAIRWAFPSYATANNVMEHCGRVAALKMAIEHAFLDDLSGPNTRILRQAARDISKGQFLPTDPENL